MSIPKKVMNLIRIAAEDHARKLRKLIILNDPNIRKKDMERNLKDATEIVISQLITGYRLGDKERTDMRKEIADLKSELLKLKSTTVEETE